MTAIPTPMSWPGRRPTSRKRPARSPGGPAWSEAEVLDRLNRLGPLRDPIEGVWTIAGDRYRIGVLRTDAGGRTFDAVVLSTTAEGWAAGEVKGAIGRDPDGRYRLAYLTGDRSRVTLAATLEGDGALLDTGRFGAWERAWPPVADRDRIARLFPAGELGLTRVSDKTLWLRIPDFDDSRAEPLKALLARHKTDLETAPNLIIDLRNNGGGSDYVYQPLLPLLYTRPIYSIGIEMRATPENIALRRAVAARIRAEAPGPAAELDAQADLLDHHLGAYVATDPKPFGAYVAKSVLPSPRRIAVLIDGAASTGEQFLLDARQSRKVTLFGKRNSAGILDFANVVGKTSPSGRLSLQWATSRSLRLPDDPVDPDGIAPDIRIPGNVADPVGYAAAWLERQAD